MVSLLPQGRLVIVPGGHRLPLESPTAVAAAISQQLDDENWVASHEPGDLRLRA
jgi:pimeloyl-ACP methyl ester carboxylesterase